VKTFVVKMNIAKLKELDFITERKNFKDLESEKRIVQLQKNALLKQIESLPDDLPSHIIEQLYKKLKDAHYGALTSPGECVGIAGAQAMGEFSTQATLNTFHVAGFELGSNVTSGVSRFQEIINASKNQKRVNCLVYFHPNSVTDLKKQLNHSIVGLLFRQCISNMYLYNHIDNWVVPCHYIFSLNDGNIPQKGYIFRYVIKRNILFQYRLHPSVILRELEAQFPNIKCAFSPLSRIGKIYFDIFFNEEENLLNIRDVHLPKIESTLVCGMSSINAYIPHFSNGEWFIEIEGGSLTEIASIPNVDHKRMVCNSVWDIFNTLGIEAAKQFLLNELTCIMSGVGLHNITLLIDKMTFNGTINSITRYTMRNEEGPIGKASFEESMETFFKAAKYGEIDNFQGISAAIIGGKKPKVGTNAFDIRVNFEKLAEIHL
jgi:DNA-directed RNA polymerase subunit A"